MPKIFNPNQPSLTLLEIYSIILAAGLLMFCYIYTSPNYFQRSGAILVCIGIFFGVVDFGNQIDKTIISTLKRMITNEENESVIFSYEQLILKLKNPITKLNYESTKYDYQYQVFYKTIRSRIILVEAIIAMVGTLVWAYGDLL